MRPYLKSSPEAISRLVAMAIITDAEVEDREIDSLDRMKLYGSVGINKWTFGDVLAEYCDDLNETLSGNGVFTITYVLVSDDSVGMSEAACLNHLLRRWGFSPQAVKTVLSN